MSDLIRTAPELESACAMCKAEGLLSLDTEFVWKSTYRPQLGLVQFGCRGGVWALDCLKGTDVTALKNLIEDPSVVKILHDARQDLQHLLHYTGALPQNVFDTQCAAAFAGFSAGIGLQRLLFEAIDVGLPKSETCTDWIQRPLSEAQVAYALDDVRYLPTLRDALLKRAQELGTATWLTEELKKYDNPLIYADYDPDEVWKRIKTGRIRLDSRGFAILRAVAAFREEKAQEWNLPKNWLGDDESLAEMANLGRVVHLRHRLKGGQADVMRVLFQKAIDAALKTPKEEWPDNPRPHYIREVQEAAAHAVEWLREKSETIHVDAAVIANRATVTAYVDNVDDFHNPLANGWRYEVVGREMAELFGVE
ncbi:MAG: ribonuclease D [Kiritimatiellia bacterium]